MTTDSEKRTRRRWSAEQKRSVLQEWDASGQSAYKFARTHGVPAANLLKWRSSASTPTRRQSRTVTFAPVQVASEGSIRNAGAERERAVLELILDGGARVRVLEGADARMVSELVLAVGRRV